MRVAKLIYYHMLIGAILTNCFLQLFSGLKDLNLPIHRILILSQFFDIIYSANWEREDTDEAQIYYCTKTQINRMTTKISFNKHPEVINENIFFKTYLFYVVPRFM